MTLAEFAHIFNTQGHLHILWMALFYVSHLIGTKIPSMAQNIIPRSLNVGLTNNPQMD